MNSVELISAAPQRLQNAPRAKSIVLYFAGILTALAVVTSFFSWMLDVQISKTGGLSDMGMRSILSTIQSMLPMVQSVVVMCLTLGYRSAMLRIARGQYASPNGLRLGFDRFWVLLRCALIQALIFLAVGVVSMNIASMLFFLTPMSDGLMEAMEPLMGGLSTLTSTELVLNEAMAEQLMDAALPLLLLFGAVYLILVIPMALMYRMADYVIIDKPGVGAIAALRESRRMMAGNRLKLLGLDLRLWWYYLALAAATVLCYGDMLLPLFGIQLPISADAAYYGFSALYLAAQFAIYYFLGNRIEVTYALAYEALRPREKQDGVVLGNIFQM